MQLKMLVQPEKLCVRFFIRCFVSVSHFRIFSCYKNIFTRIGRLKCLSAWSPSTLFVPGRQGPYFYQIVKPVINVHEIEEQLPLFKRSCNLRGLALKLDLELMRRWEETRAQFQNLVSLDSEFQVQIKEGAAVLDEKHKLVHEQIKSIKTKLYDLEDEVMPMLQQIPNIVHTFCSTDEKIKVRIPNPDLNFTALSHVQLGQNKQQLSFDPSSGLAYLTGEFAELEYALDVFFSNQLVSSNMIPMACSDFCKTFLAEAVGRCQDSCIVIEEKAEKGQKLLLVGNAALESFLAYLSNMNIDCDNLPKYYFSSGRHYDGTKLKAVEKDLFSVAQATKTQCLVLCKDAETEDNSFHHLKQIFDCCLELLSVPFRTVSIPPPRLTSVESRRIDFECFSPASNAYMYVGHVSSFGDFVSKRLQITFGKEHIVEGYCHIVEGSVDIYSLLGCMVENLQTCTGEIDTSKLTVLKDLVN